jgi:stage II sporulation protein D
VVRFLGRGWGHGVGLCQHGAYGLARSGMTYDRILAHYYPGTALESRP